MKTTSSVLILASVLVLSSGCQSWQKAEQDARAVALVTSQRILTIKKELDGKIAAERKYYKAQFDTLEKSGNRFDDTALERKKTQRALNQADDLIENKANISTELITVPLLNNSTNALDELREARDRRRAQRELSEKMIRDLQLLGGQYENLNKTLVQLTAPPTTRDQLEQVAAFLKSAAENYKRLKEQAAASSTPNSSEPTKE